MSRSSEVEPLWPARLRWRMRGAWMWPAFALLTLVDGILLHVLPPYEGAPQTLLAGVLLAGFANLAWVAVAAPVGARRLRRRRPDLPRAIAENYVGTALICAFAAVLLAAGVLHRPAVAEEQADQRAQLGALRSYVIAQAPAYRPGLRRVDSIRLQEDMYRSCVPGPERERWLCLFIETDQHPPGVRVDTDELSNTMYRRGGGFR